jgi:hypothetical protein
MLQGMDCMVVYLNASGTVVLLQAGHPEVQQQVFEELKAAGLTGEGTGKALHLPAAYRASQCWQHNLDDQYRIQ